MVVPRPLSSDKAALWSVLALAMLVQVGLGQLVESLTTHWRVAPLWAVMGILAALTAVAAYRPPSLALNEAFAWHGVGLGWIGFALGLGGLAAVLLKVQFPHLRPVAADALVMSTTMGPLLEELLYRGFIWYVVDDVVRGHVGRPAAVTAIVGTVCAVAFALVHVNPTATYFWLRFGAGLLNGILRVRSGSSLTPAAAHLSFNVVLIS